MVKTLFSVVIVISGMLLIPYWVGVEVEHQLGKFNRQLYSFVNLKPLHYYERGWFHSYAESTIETPVYRLALIQKINHGLLPIKTVQIETTLQQIGVTLLKMQTAVQINGLISSTIAAQKIVLENGNIQWDEWQLQANATQVTAQLPWLWFQNNQDQLRIAKLKVEVQEGIRGNLNLAEIDWKRVQRQVIKLDDVNLTGTCQFEKGGHLNMVMTTQVQQVQLGDSSYGTGYGDWEFKRWHLPTLYKIGEILVTYHSGIWAELIPELLAFSQHAPELRIAQWRLDTPEGPLQGQLHFQLEKWDWFNPLKAIYFQLEMTLPKTSLPRLMTSAGLNAELLIPAWLAQGILKSKENQYYLALQLREGVLLAR